MLTVVAPGAFATMGVPFKSGRDFNDSDAYEAPFTAIINETLASISFPNEDPIGHLIFNGLDSLKAMKIVGVVGNIRQYGPAKEPSPGNLHGVSTASAARDEPEVLVRTSVPPDSISPIIREKIRGLSARRAGEIQHDGSESVGNGSRAAISIDPAWSFRGARGLPRACRSLRSHVVRGGPARERDWIADGTGRESWAKCYGSFCGKRCCWPVAGIVLGFAGAAAVTRLLTSMLFGVKANRSCNLRRGDRDRARGGTSCELHPCSTRDAGRSDGGAALRNRLRAAKKRDSAFAESLVERVS